jgi:hypothetical protein
VKLLKDNGHPLSSCQCQLIIKFAEEANKLLDNDDDNADKSGFELKENSFNPRANFESICKLYFVTLPAYSLRLLQAAS